MNNNTMTDTRFDNPYMSLKFGGIKSISFSGSEEAMKFHDVMDNESKDDMIKLIQLYNGNIYNW